MLIYVMEVSNIEGSFRIICEYVMRVLRENKESVMVVLEVVSIFGIRLVYFLLICCVVYL